MPETEAQTRRNHIDKALAKAGWNINDHSKVSLEFDIYDPNYVVRDPGNPYEGHNFADYLLYGKDKTPLAVVEAKKTSRDANLGQEQAKQYAEKINQIHECKLPFVFYTNGNEINYWNINYYPPRKVYGYPTQEDLESMRFITDERRPLSIEMINNSIAGRPYQHEAIRSVLEGLEKNKRKFLLVMATGTGKTRTCLGLVDILLRAKWAKRVLFLVDRVALQIQALDDFKEHLPDSPVWPQPQDKKFETNRRIYVTTYPTMLNIIQNEKEYISPFFFDLIIADESHRSIYNVYKSVLNYFDGVKLGLTATPTDRVEHDTYEMFDCYQEEPTYAYTYKEAVENVPPYLCDFEVLKVQSKFQIDGIQGKDLSESEKKRLVEEGIDLDDIDFKGTELEKKVSNSGTNRLIIREFMEESIKDAGGVLPGKTIIFAISKKHADRLYDLFNKMYPEYNGEIAKILVSNDPRVYGKGGLLDQFKNKNFPRIAISVDMLDTGVDVREIVNLVFAKPVFSYTKFWQMIGRGTRVLDDNPEKRKPWCTEKDLFLIIDCWDNFKFFKIEPKGKEPGTQQPITVRLFRARLDKLEAALENSQDIVVEATVQELKEDITTLPTNNVIVLENAESLHKIIPGSFWQKLNESKLEYLRSTIAPVLRASTRNDIKALRFEIDVLDLATSLIQENQEKYDSLKESILEQINELPLTINIVAKECEYIEEILSEKFWNGVSEEKLRLMAKRLAPLMKYREKKLRKPILQLHEKDLVLTKEWVEFGPEHERMQSSSYKVKLENFVKELEKQNPVLQKIKLGLEVSEAEVKQLADLLNKQEPYVTEEILRKVYDNKNAKFIQFIRNILGLEKLETWSDTVSKSFENFIASHNFSSQQIHFLRMLQSYILQTGTLEKSSLINEPFIGLHPRGIMGVFTPNEAEEIVRFAKELVN